MYLPNNTLLQGGKYKIVRFLSKGGFGLTYEGVHTMMNTRVAIKEFFSQKFCSRDEATSQVTVGTQGSRIQIEKLIKKFKEEAVAVFNMKHNNIVRVLDIFEENGTAYYVMEYIDGKSLDEISKERGPLPEAEAVGYIRQIADALKYVHSLDRLHLDIKPGNIMVDKNGKAILIDFGASKHYDNETGENDSTLMGIYSEHYAPIEQFNRTFTTFSPSADIYALGATLYKLVTGITPPAASIIASGETLEIPASLSTPIRQVIIQSVQNNRMKRPQNVDEFIKILVASEDEDSTIIGDTCNSSFTSQKNNQNDEEATLFNSKPIRQEEDIPQRDFQNHLDSQCKEEEKAKKKSPLRTILFFIAGLIFVVSLFVKMLPTITNDQIGEQGTAQAGQQQRIRVMSLPKSATVTIVDENGSVVGSGLTAFDMDLVLGKTYTFNYSLEGYESTTQTMLINDSENSIFCKLEKSKPLIECGTENGHEWVDLGLSVKWATMNVGAKKESDRGMHFAWGEIKTKNNYNWNTYFDKSGEKNKDRVSESLESTGFLTYHNNGQTTITPESGHDVARTTWGGLWEMASAHDFQELIDECRWEKATVDGKKGFRAISKINNKSIFFPATGDKFNDTGSYAISGGFYWTSTLSKSKDSNAYSFSFFYDDNDNKPNLNDYFQRYYGYSVRPVLRK